MKPKNLSRVILRELSGGIEIKGMRKILYFCDNCGKDLGNKCHLSFHFAGWSGYVEPDDFGNWKHIENAVREDCIKQFCSTYCLRGYLLRPMD